MTDQPPEALTDENITADDGIAAPSDEATDPDVRNTVRGQDDADDKDPAGQADPLESLDEQESDEPDAEPRTSPTD